MRTAVSRTWNRAELAGRRGLGAPAEVVPADRIDDAYERVLAPDVRYRFVIDTATLR